MLGSTQARFGCKGLAVPRRSSLGCIRLSEAWLGISHVSMQDGRGASDVDSYRTSRDIGAGKVVPCRPHMTASC